MNRGKFAILVCCFLFGVSSSSPTVTVTRRIFNLNPDRDIFSNPSCKSSDCPTDSNCFGGSCCSCKCSYSSPNFLVKNWVCKSNGDTERLTSAGCAFSIRPDNEPLEVLELTEQSSGKHKFTSTSVRVNCSNDVIVNRWDYLDAHDQWIQGSGDVFVVSHRTVGGQNQDKKDLTFLQWNAKLDSRYAGLLIKVSLYCQNSHTIGCLLAKINGTQKYDRTSLPPTTSTSAPSTAAEPSSTPQSTTTRATPIAQVPTTGTAQNPSPATSEAEDSTQAANTKEATPSKSVPTTASKNNANAAGQQEGGTVKHESSEQQSSAPAVGSIIGVIAGIVATLCVGCIIFVAYRRRKSCFPTTSKKNDQPVVIEETYEDPIYDAVPETGPDFDNPVYCDPTGASTNRRSAQDPLPPVPGTESSYQPLNDLTRTSGLQEPPPSGTDNEAYEYTKPNTRTDYDNPPVINSPTAKESSNYDNPPTFTNDSSDLNPPLTGNSINPSLEESLDYDNPPHTALPPDYTPPTVTFVPGHSSCMDKQEEPEYFVLEPEETSM